MIIIGGQLLPTFITEFYNWDQLIANHLLTWKAGWMWLANFMHANFSQPIKIMFFQGLEEEEELQTSAAGKFAKSEAWVCVNLMSDSRETITNPDDHDNLHDGHDGLSSGLNH